MAEKKAVVTYENIMRELKAGNFSPIYILMGEEAYYIDQISNYIQNHVLKPKSRPSTRPSSMAPMSMPLKLPTWPCSSP
jgi:hypothetical protein